MNKLISGISLLLLSLPALAAEEESIVAAAPQVDADPTGMILFALVFVGLIGGYAFVIWKNEKKKKDTTK